MGDRRSISVRASAFPAIERKAALIGLSVSELVTREVDLACGLPVKPPPVCSRLIYCTGCKRRTRHRKVATNERYVRWACIACGRTKLLAKGTEP